MAELDTNKPVQSLQVEELQTREISLFIGKTIPR